MQAENERIKAKYKRLKTRYNDVLSEKKKQIQICNKESVSTADKCIQTSAVRDDPVEEKQSSRLLQTHAALVRSVLLS